MELKPGTPLQGGKYEIRSTLGRGGFGITYLAEHHMLNKLVCIKEFFPQAYYNRDSNSRSISLGSAGSAKMMEAYRNKFIKEARTIGRLQHPNVISIYDVFEENNTAYYVMEYIEGDTLAGIVKRQGPMDEYTAREFIFKVAYALDYVHKNNLLHLDVKPANIMVRSSDFHVVLIDFGLAKQYDSDGNQTSSTPVGVSQGYAPPEQYEEGAGNTFTPATDIYALGATYYYITTGKVPPSSSAIMDGGLPSLVQYLTPSVQRVILGSLQPSRRMRAQSVSEFFDLFNADTIVPQYQPQYQPQYEPQYEPQYQSQYQQQYQPQYEPQYQPQPRPAKKPGSHILFALIALVMFFPVGVVALARATKVNRLWREGNYAEAQAFSRSALTRSIVSLLLGLPLWLLIILIAAEI